MNALETFIFQTSNAPTAILDSKIPFSDYVPIDLSKDNKELASIDITDHTACQGYITSVLNTSNGQVAYGGYLEHRNLYAKHQNFSNTDTPVRDIHLGVDFWCVAGTKVITPLDGAIHSFQDNKTKGDYGPTLILKHQVKNQFFYTLYGHLSLSSLDGLFEGKKFKKGSILGYLGTPDINVNYAPHLHFQVIYNLEGSIGDYPGVCAIHRLSYYKQNCPNPNLLLKFPSTASR